MMSRFYLGFTLVLALCSFGAQAQGEQVDTSQVIITTPAPEPKEVIVEPEGYISCSTVEGGWYENQWYPERRVCQYTPGSNPNIKAERWIAGYWVCNQYKAEEPSKGECTNWEWKAGHWAKATENY